MSDSAYLVVGGPDSGKTNYIARLWVALSAGSGSVTLPAVPDNISYVEEALGHLHAGAFAPRSQITDGRRDFALRILVGSPKTEVQIVVPDVSGELWVNALETSELPADWMREAQAARGALVFVRVLSDLNVNPLDWVTSSRLLKAGIGEGQDVDKIPTQVMLCEWIRFLETKLARPNGRRPRLAIIVTAWDRLDSVTSAAGPRAFLDQQYPLLAGKLRDHLSIDVEVFGVSIVGGDLGTDPEFRSEFMKGDLEKSGFVVTERQGGVTVESDLTIPLAWLAAE